MVLVAALVAGSAGTAEAEAGGAGGVCMIYFIQIAGVGWVSVNKIPISSVNITYIERSYREFSRWARQ